MDEAMKSADTSPLPFSTSQTKGQHRPSEQGRNPYDGLRPWSSATHGLGIALAVLGTILLFVRAISLEASIWHIVSFSIYGASMIGLYTASTLYHSLNINVSGRIALRKYDHSSIYFLIAGTYTPLCLTALRGPWGWSLFGIIWVLAIAGTVMALVWINCPRALTSTIYIAMGWMALVAIYPLAQKVGWRGLLWLLAGGVLYTIGGVLYALKWPGKNNPRFGCHEIFHVFIVLGSICHFLMMYRVIVYL